jgi:hypothetical protein
LVEGGANIRAVQELLGHADLTTTAVYLGLAPKHLEEAIRTLANTTESRKQEINDSAITPRVTQPVSTHPNVTNISNDPLIAALQVMVEPANLYQALKPENVEELQLNTMPIIDMPTADKLKGILENNIKKQKPGKTRLINET